MSNPFVFRSLDEALRDTRVYEQARHEWKTARAEGRHTGPRNRISDEEIKRAVKTLWEKWIVCAPVNL